MTVPWPRRRPCSRSDRTSAMPSSSEAEQLTAPGFVLDGAELASGQIPWGSYYWVYVFGFVDPAGFDLDRSFNEAFLPQARKIGADGVMVPFRPFPGKPLGGGRGGAAL